MSRLAILLIGGQGTRLKPYTITFPKPLMPVGDYPILEINVRQLRSHGFTNLVFAANHQAELIKAYFGDGARWGVSIRYSIETVPLGTIGPIRLVDPLPDDFLLMNGDILTDLDFSKFFDQHITGGSAFTISSYLRQDKSQYGVLEVVDDRLVRFAEKPVLSTEVSMGIYAASRRVLDLIPTDKPYGFDQLMLDMLARGTPPQVKRFSGHWLDIGIPADYERATEMFLANRDQFLPKD